MDTCYLNGTYINKEDAKVSVFDRGFLFSDGVYEVIPAYNSTPFLIHEHIKRLNDGLTELKINFDTKDIYSICYDLIEKNKPKESFSIYIQVTRGEQNGRDHRFLNLNHPSVFIGLQKCAYPTTYDQAHKALLKKDIRWEKCFIKSISLLPNVLYKQLAADSNCLETIMHKEDKITEASASNVWAVKDNVIYTPPTSDFILNGITRVFLLQALKQHNLEVYEKPISKEQLIKADEVWVTSSTKEIQPIVKVDDNVIGKGVIGEMYSKAVNAFNKAKDDYYYAKKFL